MRICMVIEIRLIGKIIHRLVIPGGKDINNKDLYLPYPFNNIWLGSGAVVTVWMRIRDATGITAPLVKYKNYII